MGDGRIVKRMAALGITLPAAAPPAANYVGAVRSGRLLSVSGQGPVNGLDILFTGRVGQDISLEQGQEAARLTCLNVLAQAAALLDGDLDRIIRVVKLFGLVNCAPDFDQQGAGDERRLRFDGRHLWRGRAPCPRGGWHACPTLQYIGGNRWDIRGRISWPQCSWRHTRRADGERCYVTNGRCAPGGAD